MSFQPNSLGGQDTPRLTLDTFGSVFAPPISDEFVQTPVANTLYAIACKITDERAKITGIQYLPSVIAGNVLVSAYDYNGAGGVIAQSASTARAGTAFLPQLVPFTTPLSGFLGTLAIGIQFSSVDNVLGNSPLQACAAVAQGSFTVPSSVSFNSTNRTFTPILATY